MTGVGVAEAIWRRVSTAAWLRGANRVGTGVRLDARPDVRNLGRIEVGSDVRIASAPVQSHLETGPGGTLIIGDGVHIGHGASVSAHTRVSIGAGAHLGPFVMILDSDFHVAGKHDDAGASGPIEIGPGARIGSRVTILRGANIGAGAEIAAGSVVSGTIPPGTKAGGVPARVIASGAPSVGAERLDVAVPLVIQRALRLPVVPELTHGPAQIAQWDSLGTLSLLLSLEESFGVTLNADDIVKVHAIADLVGIVSLAQERRAARASGA